MIDCSFESPSSPHMSTHARGGNGMNVTPGRVSSPRISTHAQRATRLIFAIVLTTLAFSSIVHAAPRDAAPRDAAPRDAAPRDAAPRDAAKQSFAPRDAAKRNPLLHDVTAPRPAAPDAVGQADVAKGAVSAGAVSGASARVYEVARELVCDCPDCGKQALDQCPNCEIGRKYRAVIDGQLKQGRTKSQIIAYFATTYGDHILGTPRPQGFGRAAFTLPAMAVFMGLLPLSIVLRRRKRKHASFDAPTDSDSSRSDAVSLDATAKPVAEDPRLAAALRDYDF
jgi:cytochrome c-type biogenesis protein CcmH/NrfF